MREPLVYEQRQFRNVLYTLLILGFTGFSLAAGMPWLWVLAVGGTLVNMWLVYRGSFRPIPRFVANVITLLFAGWMVIEVRSAAGGTAIFAIGEFLTYLQLVKLYEQRGNRDLAQLLVLSLLLTVAGAISTASLVFGILFLVYLLLSLYACLLFHLKAESDYARAVMRNRDRPISATQLRQSQKFLSRSMRRLTGCVSAFALVVGIVVFLLFPRGTGAGLIGNISITPGDAMTGFTDSVDFQQVARLNQNDSKVAYVVVRQDGKLWGGSDKPLLLRGNALDSYSSDPSSSDHWTWSRTVGRGANNLPYILEAGRKQELGRQRRPDSSQTFHQDIRLLPTGSKTLFAMPGIVSITPSHELRFNYGVVDRVVQMNDQLRGEMSYSVESTNTPAPSVAAVSFDGSTPKKTGGFAPEIKTFALRNEVAGVDSAGNLGQQRLARNTTSELDEKLARNFEKYLQSNFDYSLDLTDIATVDERDPLVRFLYDYKRGHCEYFAGAMTAMCQSVGLQARMVVGFKCYDYNSVGEYYLVKQSDAHAWVEVLTLKGWQTFDPTSGSSTTAAHTESLWKRASSFFNFLEYKWGNAVVNYDTDTRNSLIGKVDTRLGETSVRTNGWFKSFREWLEKSDYATLTNRVLTALVALTAAVCVGAVLYFIYERFKLRRRAGRIGLSALPSGDRRRLAKQLLFYDELLRTLDRRRVPRPPHLTPREFSQSVGFLPAEIFDVIQRLTRVFYRVRYGGAELQIAQQRRLLRVVNGIDDSINTSRRKAK